jgi:hypothetical protein
VQILPSGFVPPIPTEREAKLLSVGQSAGLVWGVQSNWLETCQSCGDSFYVTECRLSERGETFCRNCFKE